MFSCAKILFLVSLLFVAVIPTHFLNFKFLIILNDVIKKTTSVNSINGGALLIISCV